MTTTANKRYLTRTARRLLLLSLLSFVALC